jgi:hypothetical protein
MQRYKAQGKSIATSIDAFAEGVWDEARKAFHMVANSLKLGQIDIAPADRAGIPGLAAVPILTTEMSDREDNNEQEPEMDKYQVIREMTAEDADLLPKAVKEAVISTVPQPETPAEVGLVAEMRQALEAGDKADLVALVTELRQERETRKKDAVKSRITELANERIKVDSVRGLVVELVNARNPQTVEEAETTYQQVVEMESVKQALAVNVQQIMGPRQRTPLQSLNGKGGKYFNIPQEDK